ncbi:MULTISPECIES: hypothetical protein [Listeria]|uniref:hypothetical protein n=1 Tax=Listeria TaxID=1637 RepID=UPI000B596A51|nr:MULTISPECIES: hypothetical protein [Listeria]
MTYEELPSCCYIEWNGKAKLVYKECRTLYDTHSKGSVSELNIQLGVSALEAEMMYLAATFTGFSYLKRHMGQCERIAESMLRQLQMSHLLLKKGAS